MAWGWVACLKPTVPQSACPGNAVTVAVVYFKSEDDGDGTYEGRIGHAYLHVDDDASEDKEHDLGLITLARARAIAAEHGADLDIDGPTRAEWNG
jgi:hypothetical protein